MFEIILVALDGSEQSLLAFALTLLMSVVFWVWVFHCPAHVSCIDQRLRGIRAIPAQGTWIELHSRQTHLWRVAHVGLRNRRYRSDRCHRV